MKKFLTLLALALLIALPACRKDKDHKKDDRRAKTTKKHDGKDKKMHHEKKAHAKKAPMKKGTDRATMIDEDDLD